MITDQSRLLNPQYREAVDRLAREVSKLEYYRSTTTFVDDQKYFEGKEQAYRECILILHDSFRHEFARSYHGDLSAACCVCGFEPRHEVHYPLDRKPTSQINHTEAPINES